MNKHLYLIIIDANEPGLFYLQKNCRINLLICIKRDGPGPMAMVLSGLGLGWAGLRILEPIPNTRSEIQGLRRHPTPVETPILEATGPQAQDAPPLTSTCTGVDSRTTTGPPIFDPSTASTAASLTRQPLPHSAIRPPTATPPSKLYGSVSLRNFRACKSAWNDYSFAISPTSAVRISWLSCALVSLKTCVRHHSMLLASMKELTQSSQRWTRSRNIFASNVTSP